MKQYTIEMITRGGGSDSKTDHYEEYNYGNDDCGNNNNNNSSIGPDILAQPPLKCQIYDPSKN